MVRNRVRLFGYPFHPTLIVFPMALFPASLLADLAALATGDAFWWRAGLWAIGIGLVGTVAAVATGLVDYPSVPTRAKDLAWRHAAMGFSILALYGMILWMHTFDPWGTAGIFPFAIGLNVVGQILLSFQGVWGGWLVYRHRMGVDESSGSASNRRPESHDQ